MTEKSQLCDVLRAEINIVDYARSIGLTPIETPTWHNVTHRLAEHDSVRINADENVYYRNSTGRGGGIIDFCMEFGDGHGPMRQDEAIRHLRSVLSDRNPSKVQRDSGKDGADKKTKNKVQNFELPAPAKNTYRRVYAYLVQTRCIDEDLIRSLMHDGLIYQDKRGNAVFCGRDYDGEIKFASLRTTNTDVVFRGDVAASRKEIGFSIGLIGKSPRRLFVCESAIDAMSLATLVKHFNAPPLSECAFLSLGSVAESAIKYHLPRNPTIETVYLCQDNDRAGDTAREKMRKTLQDMRFKGRVVDKPSKGKDYNEDLCALRKSISMNQKMERGMQHELV